MNDLKRAKEILFHADAANTCVLCKEDAVHTSQKKGIAPMMDLLDSGADLHGFCASDRIVGRAAAMLFVLAGVRAVYAEVITDGAIRILENAGIPCEWGTCTARIINRRGDGPCPMEQAVEGIDDPRAARVAIRETMLRLTQK